MKTLNLAHRGFSGKYPENTKIAFEKAVETHCDGFETDVHITKDNAAVIIHDPTLDRTSDGKGFIKDYTFKELQDFNVGVNFLEKGIPPQRIMLLDELLEMVSRNNLFINIELKNYEVFYENMEKIVLDKLDEFKLADQSVVSSFNHISIAKCKSINKKIKTGFLYGYPLINMWDYLKQNNTDALHPNYKSILFQPELVEKTHKVGGAVNTWTVNDRPDMQKMLELRVDSIITNFPDELYQVMHM